MGPVGTSRVSAVWRFAASRETRCLGASFAGSRVTGTVASFSSWIRTSRSVGASGSGTAGEIILFFDFVDASCCVVRFPGGPLIADIAIKSRTS